nr:protein ACCELERATED CELL DEATH 6-like [Ipomoea trifida]
MASPASRSLEVPAGNNGGGGGAVHRYFGGHTDQDMVNAAHTQIIVATLITTIAFAAAFAVPGSYETEADQAQPKGAPILLKRAAFQAFLVTNTVAFVCSLAAIFAYIVMSEEASLYKRSKTIAVLYDYAGYLLLVALVAVALAFVTGSYSILAHSTAIAVTVTVLGLTYFPLIYYVFRVFLRGGAVPNV